jgi:hypothetical protein
VRPVPALLAALVAIAIAGCGSEDAADRFSGDSADAARAVERLGAAARAGDTATICTTLLAESVIGRLGPRCPARIAPALRTVNDSRLEVVAVHVRGATARVTVVAGTAEPPRSGDLDLILERGHWVITGVGPLPPAGS